MSIPRIIYANTQGSLGLEITTYTQNFETGSVSYCFIQGKQTSILILKLLYV